MDHDKQIDFLVIIADRKKKDEIVALLVREGAKVINTLYGKGSVKGSSVQFAFGFVPEEHKIIATCLMPNKKSDAVLDALNMDFHFNRPNTGIAFTVPVEGLSY